MSFYSIFFLSSVFSLFILFLLSFLISSFHLYTLCCTMVWKVFCGFSFENNHLLKYLNGPRTDKPLGDRSEKKTIRAFQRWIFVNTQSFYTSYSSSVLRFSSFSFIFFSLLIFFSFHVSLRGILFSVRLFLFAFNLKFIISLSFLFRCVDNFRFLKFNNNNGAANAIKLLETWLPLGFKQQFITRRLVVKQATEWKVNGLSIHFFSDFFIFFHFHFHF